MDEDDVALLAGWAHAEGIALIPRGAGTGMPGGNVGVGVAVDLSLLRSLAPLEPGRGVLLAGAGITGAQVEAAAGAGGLFLPALPSSADRCTVGGMAANNAAGTRSFRYGALRSFAETLRVVRPDGEILPLRRGGGVPPSFAELRRALDQRFGSTPLPWPAVRKNSSGYALDAFLPSGDPVDLLVGSEGTLGLITEVGLRLAPIPPCRALVMVPLAQRAILPDLVVLAGRMGAAACEFFDGRFLDIAGLRRESAFADLVAEAPALGLLELEGEQDLVEDGIRSLATFGRDSGVDIRIGRTAEEMERLWKVRHAASPVVASRAADGLISMQFIEDSVVRPSDLPDYLVGLDEILEANETDAVVFGHAGDGNVHVNPLVDVRRPDWRARVRRILEATVELVADLGGTLSGEHGDGRLRGSFHPSIFGEDVASAFAQVKSHLDPRGVLNPGVIVPLPGQDPLAGLTHVRRAP